MNKMNFQQTLNEIMIEKRLSQQSVANAIGVSQKCVSKWLRGESEPTATNIFNLAIFFEISADYLLGLCD